MFLRIERNGLQAAPRRSLAETSSASTGVSGADRRFWEGKSEMGAVTRILVRSCSYLERCDLKYDETIRDGYFFRYCIILIFELLKNRKLWKHKIYNNIIIQIFYWSRFWSFCCFKIARTTWGDHREHDSGTLEPQISYFQNAYFYILSTRKTEMVKCQISKSLICVAEECTRLSGWFAWPRRTISRAQNNQNRLQ